jgi:hypothetical protein
MSEGFDRRVRQLLHHTASVIGEDDARDLLAAIGSTATAPVRPKQRGLMRLRTLAVAAAVIAVLAVTVGVVRPVRPSQSPDQTAHTSASPSAPAELGCPSGVPTGKISSPRTLKDMVATTPTEGLLCKYGQLPQQKLVGSKGIPASRLTELRTRLNSLPPPLTVACPMDDGSAYLLVLRGTEGDQTIVVRPTGCGEVTDGHQVRRIDLKLMSFLVYLP